MLIYRVNFLINRVKFIIQNKLLQKCSVNECRIRKVYKFGKLTIKHNFIKVQTKQKYHMLIQQVVQQQTISILDKILQADTAFESKANLLQSKSKSIKKYSSEEYSQFLKQNGVIKSDQMEIFKILIKKHLESKGLYKEHSNQQNEYKFDQNQAYTIIKQIKRNIKDKTYIEQPQNTHNQTQNAEKQTQRRRNIKQPKIKTNKEDEQNQNSQDQNQKNSFGIQVDKKVFPLRQNNNKDQTNQFTPRKQPSLGKISKKLKKQNQFISRNINQIKSYTHSNIEPVFSVERTQIQEIKISHQICHKLFHTYKAVYSSEIANNKQVEMLNFDNKEQYKSTLNYHKVLQMFKDASLKLEIQNKLSVLRILKKFSFNPNFVTLEEWNKIYRSLINNLNVKQVTLQRLVKLKEEQKKGKPIISLLKSKPQKFEQYRTRRIKTQSSLQQTKFVSMGNIGTENANETSQHSRMDFLSNKNGIKPIQNGQRIQIKLHNPNEYRSRHKKLLTEVSEVVIRNIKNQCKKDKMIGFMDRRQQNQTNEIEADQQLSNDHSYLKKAIRNKKISKLTWETLFQMKEDTMHYNIVIPEFAKQLLQFNLTQ